MNPGVAYAYAATILEWHDGDTVKLEVDQGFEDFKKSWFRLYGVDCKELETPEGKAAHEYVSQKWPVGTKLIVVSKKGEYVPIGKEKYGRWLADLYPPLMAGSVSGDLLATGHGVRYFGGKKGVAV